MTNEDIKEIYSYHRNIVIEDRYIEKRNYRARNEIFSCDISTYVLIIDKIEYLNKICLEKFEKDDERIMFIIIQLAKYIKYECELINGISHGNKEYANSKIDLYNKSNHAWNRVKIDDNWYNIDLAWFVETGDSKWLLSNDTDFEDGDRHVTDQKEHLCRKNYDVQRKNKLLEQMQKYESFLERYDKRQL